MIKISVIDTGIGISKENIKKLFLSYSKINDKSSKQMNGQGCGLGLSISYKLAVGLAHNDNGIQVKSEVNKGSEFSFIIEDKTELDDNYENCDIS